MKLLLLCSTRRESIVSLLPQHIILYICSRMTWDWFVPEGEEPPKGNAAMLATAHMDLSDEEWEEESDDDDEAMEDPAFMVEH